MALEEDYQVEAFSTAETAIDAIKSNPPDLVLLDIGLPGGDGHTVADRLRKNVNSMSIPVVYLTARNSEVDKQRAADAGAAAYLTKPFKAEELIEIVTRLVIGIPVGST